MAVLQLIVRELMAEYNKGKKLGGVLVDLGYLSPEALNTELDSYDSLDNSVMFGSYLVSKQLITTEKLEKALDYQTNFDFSQVLKLKNDKEIMESCLENGIKKSEIIRRFENRSGAKYIELSSYSIAPETIKTFNNIEDLKKNNIIPFHVDKAAKLFKLATSDITDQAGIQSDLRSNASRNGYACEFLFAFQFEIEEKYNKLVSTKTQTELIKDNQSAVDFVTSMFTEAIERNASDIHFEPQKTGVRVRYRIDGLLIKSYTYNYDQTAIKEIVALLKTKSGMDQANSRKPQGGGIKDYLCNGKTYDIRSSVIQTINGEKAVMRVIPKGATVKSFKELGYPEYYESQVKDISEKTGGILFIAGSTGSGKTTTLYTIIDHINKPDKNICSIEDPVEKEVPGINQVNISLTPGASITERSEKFAENLLEFLRQDPDVIVIGEIRDKSVGEIALKASLTGHLVITTIHANSALNTLTRLYDMDIDNIILSSSVLGILAQKLIRKVCSECQVERKLTDDESVYVEYINKKYSRSYALDHVHYGKGCNTCNNTGYYGRIAVPELVVIDDEVKKLIYAKTSVEVIHTKLLEKGYRTIELNAFMSVIDGLTTIDEVKRIL